MEKQPRFRRKTFRERTKETHHPPPLVVIRSNTMENTIYKKSPKQIELEKNLWAALSEYLKEESPTISSDKKEV